MKAGKIVNNNSSKTKIGWKYQKDYHYKQEFGLIKVIEREAKRI